MRRMLLVRKISVNGTLEKINQRIMRYWIDKFSFLHLFLVWLFVVVGFGWWYYSFPDQLSYLYSPIVRSHVQTLSESIYFSFITATTTGFGDIIPFGIFKLMAIIEVIFGLLLLAVVTSKLVSIKQDVILGELYELSFNEQISQLRSALLEFRQNLERLMGKVEEGILKRRETNEIIVHLSSFEHQMTEISMLVGRSKGDELIKNMDPVDTELIFEGVVSSFEKIHELVVLLDQHKLDWRGDAILTLLRKCIILNEGLFEKLNTSKSVTKETLVALNNRKEKMIALLKSRLQRPEKKLSTFWGQNTPR